jgi:aminopeptidase N
LSCFRSWMPTSMRSDFLRWINHPSYYVAGAALTAYLENENNVNREEIAGRFENEKNIRMLVALAGHYLSEETTGKSAWFSERLDQLNGENRYYFLGIFQRVFFIRRDQ